MTDYETLAELGFIEPRIAETSGNASPHAPSRPDTLVSPAPAGVVYPSRRSLRDGVVASAPVVPAVPTPAVVSVADAPVQHLTRRAAREAAAAAPAQPAAPIVPASAPTAPQVAAPFGIFEAPAVEPIAHESRRANRAPAKRSRAERNAGSPSAKSAASRIPLRKRLTAAGTMVLVGGLFVSLGLPAYADNDYASAALADAAAAADGQTLSLAADTTADVVADGARDGYDATSAADLKRLYRDAVRQQNLAAYLASGAKAMGDDYPWAAELSRGQGGGLSPLRYFYRECVDFVAWRLNRDAGSTTAPFKLDWGVLTPGGGNASSWKRQWEIHGWATSTTPAAGWVAWFPGQNHVGYVSGVLSDGSVAIEEYNFGSDHLYGQRVIAAGDAIYLSPPPV